MSKSNLNEDPDPVEFYKDTRNRFEGRLHRLITLRIKNAILNAAYYNKGRSEDSSIFDIVQPEEEADMIIKDLRFFGLMPPERKGKK